MTPSAPPEPTPAPPRDRPGPPPSRRLARLAGIFFVITFISIPALPLYDQVLNHTQFIVGSGGDARVFLGALFELITLAAGIGTAVTLYPGRFAVFAWEGEHLVLTMQRQDGEGPSSAGPRPPLQPWR